MHVNEMYVALNGEGVHVGVPVTIIRLQGCNLACKYCDTQYAQMLVGGFDMEPKDIAAKVSRKLGRVLITGGEPLIQIDELHVLVDHLHDRGIEVEIETNGSIKPPTWWKTVDCWSADIKCPSSGMCGASITNWLGVRDCDQIKFVVATWDDLEYASRTFGLAARHDPTILISPTYPWTQQWLENCVEFCKVHGARLSLQQHKIIYGNQKERC